jgi:lysophospholipase L1-like esterase
MMNSPWPSKTLLAMATFAAGITFPRLVPQWHNWRVYEWEAAWSVLDFQPRARSVAPVEEELEKMRPDMAQGRPEELRIADPKGAMARFYSSLLATERAEPGAVTRILHYGDSPTTADMITADVRVMLQQRFGDAGHGTHLIAKPWAWYKHRGVEVTSHGWTIEPATLHQEKDGRYGLAGVSFLGEAGAWSRFHLKEPGHTSVLVSYMGLPGGGELTVLAGSESAGDLATDAGEEIALEKAFAVPAEAQDIEIRVKRGRVRVFSVTFRKEGPGIVYDSLGLNGVWAGVLGSYTNEEHWAQELRRANPDLVIINYGTNESGDPKYVNGTYSRDVREVLRRVQKSLPLVSVLVMSPMDRGTRESGGVIGTVPGLPQLVAIQSQLAMEQGCAFFNTFLAMGGPGTMGKWYMAEPRLVSADFIHPMPSGAKIVGSLLYQAILDGYNSFKLKRLREQRTAEVRQTR